MISEDRRLKNELVALYDNIIETPSLTDDGNAVNWFGLRYRLLGQYCPID